MSGSYFVFLAIIHHTPKPHVQTFLFLPPLCIAFQSMIYGTFIISSFIYILAFFTLISTFLSKCPGSRTLLYGLSNSCHIWQSSAAAMRSSCASVGDSFAFSISFSVVLDIPHFFDSLRSEYPLQFRISQIFMTIMQILCARCDCMSL